MWCNHTIAALLKRQLDDPLAIISGALPPWCRVLLGTAPSLVPRADRLDYLRRHLFGVSRAIASVQTAAEAPLTRSLVSSRNNAIAKLARGEDPMDLFDACDFIEAALTRIKERSLGVLKVGQAGGGGLRSQ